MSKVKLIGISGGGLNIVNFLESNFSQNYEQKNIEDLNAILENGEKVYIFCTLAGTTGEENLLKIKEDIAYSNLKVIRSWRRHSLKFSNGLTSRSSLSKL